MEDPNDAQMNSYYAARLAEPIPLGQGTLTEAHLALTVHFIEAPPQGAKLELTMFQSGEAGEWHEGWYDAEPAASGELASTFLDRIPETAPWPNGDPLHATSQGLASHYLGGLGGNDEIVELWIPLSVDALTTEAALPGGVDNGLLVRGLGYAALDLLVKSREYAGGEPYIVLTYCEG
jgi:hypothetical protein